MANDFFSNFNNGADQLDLLSTGFGLDTSSAQQSLGEMAQAGTKSLGDINAQAQKTEQVLEGTAKNAAEAFDELGSKIAEVQKKIELLDKAAQRIGTSGKQVTAFIDPSNRAYGNVTSVEDAQRQTKTARELLTQLRQARFELKAEIDKFNSLSSSAKEGFNLLASGVLEDHPEKIAGVKKTISSLTAEIERLQKITSKTPQQQGFLEELQKVNKFNARDLQELNELEQKNIGLIKQRAEALAAQEAMQKRLSEATQRSKDNYKFLQQRDAAKKADAEFQKDRNFGVINLIPGLRPDINDPVNHNYFTAQRKSAAQAFSNALPGGIQEFLKNTSDQNLAPLRSQALQNATAGAKAYSDAIAAAEKEASQLAKAIEKSSRQGDHLLAIFEEINKEQIATSKVLEIKAPAYEKPVDIYSAMAQEAKDFNAEQKEVQKQAKLASDALEKEFTQAQRANKDADALLNAVFSGTKAEAPRTNNIFELKGSGPGKVVDEYSQMAKSAAEFEAQTKNVAKAQGNLDKQIKNLTSSFLQARKAEADLKKSDPFSAEDINSASRAVDKYKAELHAALEQAKALGLETANVVRAHAALSTPASGGGEGGFFGAIGGAISGVGEAFGNVFNIISKIGFAIYGVEQTVRTMVGAVDLVKKSFIDTNVQLEQAELAIAGVFNNAYVESFETSLKRSKGFVSALREEAVKTNLTFQELFQSATTALPQLINRGATEDQALTIISKISQAGKFALGDRFEPSRLNDEIRALLNKQVTGRTNETLQFLGITNADLKPLKTVSDLLDLINKKTLGLEASNKEFQKTFLGGTDRMQDEFFRLGTEIGKPLFREVTVSLLKFNEAMQQGKYDGFINVIQNMVTFLAKLTRELDHVMNSLAAFSKTGLGKTVLYPATLANQVVNADLRKSSINDFVNLASDKDLKAGLDNANTERANRLYKYTQLINDKREIEGLSYPKAVFDKLDQDISTALKEYQHADLEVKKIKEEIDKRANAKDVAEGKLPPGTLRNPDNTGLGTGNVKAKNPKTPREIILPGGLRDGLNQEQTEVDRIVKEYERALDRLTVKADATKTALKALSTDGIGELAVESEKLAASTKLTQVYYDKLDQKVKELQPELEKLKKQFYAQRAVAQSLTDKANAANAVQAEQHNAGEETGAIPITALNRILPVQGVIKSPFGEKNHGTHPHVHQGVDIAAALGTPVVAPAAGEVTEVQTVVKDGRGKYIVIRTDDGFVNKFFHLSDAAVQVGQRVTQNEVIGKVGSTGDSTGPHLHFQVSDSKGNINPLDLKGRTGDVAASSVAGDLTNDAREAVAKAEDLEKRFDKLQKQYLEAIAQRQKASDTLVKAAAEELTLQVETVQKVAARAKQLKDTQLQTSVNAHELNLSVGERDLARFGETATKVTNELELLNAELKTMQTLEKAGGYAGSDGKFHAFTKEEAEANKRAIEQQKALIDSTASSGNVALSTDLQTQIQDAITQTQNKIGAVTQQQGLLTQSQIDAITIKLNNSLLEVLGKIRNTAPGDSVTVTDSNGVERQIQVTDQLRQDAINTATSIEATNRQIAQSYRLDVATPLKDTFDQVFDGILNGSTNLSDALLNLFKNLATQLERLFSQQLFDIVKVKFTKLQQEALGNTVGPSLAPTDDNFLNQELSKVGGFGSAVTIAAKSIRQSSNNDTLQNTFQNIFKSQSFGKDFINLSKETGVGGTVAGGAASVEQASPFTNLLKGRQLAEFIGGAALLAIGESMAQRAQGRGKAIGSAYLSAAGGALSGAAIGSVVPGIGTALGAIIGGLAGGGSAIDSNASNGGYFSTKGGVALAFALGGPLGFLALAGRKKAIAAQTAQNEQKNTDFANQLLGNADQADLQSLLDARDRLISENSKQVKSHKRGKKPLRDAIDQVNKQIEALKKQAADATAQVDVQLADYDRPDAIRGIEPKIQQNIKDLTALLKEGLDPAKVMDLFNKQVEDDVRTLTNQLNDVNKQIANGAEDKQGNLISLQQDLQNQIQDLQSNQAKQLESIRSSYSSQASSILSEGRASAISPSAADRQLRLAKLAAQQNTDETTTKQDTTNAILKLQNDTARNIADLQKQAVNIQQAILFTLNEAIQLAPTMLTGITNAPTFNTDYLNGLLNFFNQNNPFANLSIPADQLGGLSGLTIQNLSVSNDITDTQLLALIKQALAQAANATNSQRQMQSVV